MEHELMQNTGDEELPYELGMISEIAENFLDRLTSSSEPHENPLALALIYAHQFQFSLPVAFLALGIAHTADSMMVFWNTPAEPIAAASVYIASHILNHPRSLTDLARLTLVSERTIFSAYRAIYLNRYELVDEDWRQIVGGTTLGEAAEALPSLPWPPLQHEFADNEVEDGEPVEASSEGEPSAIGGVELVKELCCDNNNNRISSMAQNIADRMDSMTIDWKTANPWTIAAACTYMASHLVFQGKTFEEVSVISGIPSVSILNTYRVMCRSREQIVQEDWFENFSWTSGYALYCLPKI